MGTIIDFNTAENKRLHYEEALQGIQAALEAFHEELIEDAFQLALLDAWRDWDKEQPAGTTLQLDLAMLEECSDRRVRQLMDLATRINGTINTIRTDPV